MNNSNNTTKQWIPETGDDHVPEDKDKRLVVTPYGKGTVRRTRTNNHTDGITCEVELSDWTAANDGTAARKPTMLYAPESSLTSVPPTVGCDVVCFAGRGQVIAIEEQQEAEPAAQQNKGPASSSSRSDGEEPHSHDDQSRPPPTKLTIVLSSWRLANRCRVRCYLSSSAVQVVRAKRLYEMDAFEKIEYAFSFKDGAGKVFQQQQYALALEEYSRAVGAVKYVQHKNDAPNSLRADLLVVMITCSNNAGTCCIKLGGGTGGQHNTDRGVEFAKQSLDIHGELLAAGYADAKVFGEWKVKACLILATGLGARGDVEEALTILHRARATVAEYPSSTVLQRTEREIVKLAAALKGRRKAQVAKERRRARAMFATAAARNDDHDPAVTSSTEEKPTIRSAKKTNESSSGPTKPNKDKSNRQTTSSIGLYQEWFQSPMVLSGLGIVAAGVAGALLVYNQSLRKSRV